jgi:predicted RNase H-like HicB family nuclease
MKFRVLIERDEDDIFIATVPSLPGCISDGATREEAVTNIREAISLYLESLEEHGDAVPPPITEELVEVDV